MEALNDGPAAAEIPAPKLIGPWENDDDEEKPADEEEEGPTAPIRDDWPRLEDPPWGNGVEETLPGNGVLDVEQPPLLKLAPLALVPSRACCCLTNGYL